MKHHAWQILLISLFAGCQDSVKPPLPFRELPASATTRTTVTNRFGMTFCFVEVTSAKYSTFPKHSFYLQQSTLTYEQFSEYKKVSGADVRFPTEWRECDYFARALSELDAEYDYRLPSRKEWTFACMNGAAQDCPHSTEERDYHHSDERPNRHPPRPNCFGIHGFLDGDLECVDTPGMFMGMGDPPQHSDDPQFPCLCEQFTSGNPDADDGLNELIVARFVLIPK